MESFPDTIPSFIERIMEAGLNAKDELFACEVAISGEVPIGTKRLWRDARHDLQLDGGAPFGDLDFHIYAGRTFKSGKWQYHFTAVHINMDTMEPGTTPVMHTVNGVKTDIWSYSAAKATRGFLHGWELTKFQALMKSIQA